MVKLAYSAITGKGTKSVSVPLCAYRILKESLKSVGGFGRSQFQPAFGKGRCESIANHGKPRPLSEGAQNPGRGGTVDGTLG